jgi:hypothetical protein
MKPKKAIIRYLRISRPCSFFSKFVSFLVLRTIVSPRHFVRECEISHFVPVQVRVVDISLSSRFANLQPEQVRAVKSTNRKRNKSTDMIKEIDIGTSSVLQVAIKLVLVYLVLVDINGFSAVYEPQLSTASRKIASELTSEQVTVLKNEAAEKTRNGIDRRREWNALFFPVQEHPILYHALHQESISTRTTKTLKEQPGGY